MKSHGVSSEPVKSFSPFSPSWDLGQLERIKCALLGPVNAVPIIDSTHIPVFHLQVWTMTLRPRPAFSVSAAVGEGQGEAPAVTLAWRLWREGAGQGAVTAQGKVPGPCLLLLCASLELMCVFLSPQTRDRVLVSLPSVTLSSSLHLAARSPVNSETPTV